MSSVACIFVVFLATGLFVFENLQDRLVAATVDHLKATCFQHAFRPLGSPASQAIGHEDLLRGNSAN